MFLNRSLTETSVVTSETNLTLVDDKEESF